MDRIILWILCVWQISYLDWVLQLSDEYGQYLHIILWSFLKEGNLLQKKEKRKKERKKEEKEKKKENIYKQSLLQWFFNLVAGSWHSQISTFA